MSDSRTFHENWLALALCACVTLWPLSLLALDPDRSLSEYLAARWDEANSFPGGAIHAIAQTPNGFLWIGTENGLVRFDGTRFRLLDRANSSLPSGHVLGLAVDAQGVLWVRMQSPYLMRYRDGSFEQMYPLQLPSPFSAAREGGATALIRGTHGDVLIAPPDGPLRYSGGKFIPLAASGEAGGLAISMMETADGVVWIGMRDAGLFRVRDGRASQVGLADQKVNALLPGAGSEVWVGTDSGLYRWDGKIITKRGVPATLARSPILALARDSESNLWISTPSGITRITPSGAAAHQSNESFPGTVHAIFEDREGNLWFGGTEGLMQLRDTRFFSYTGVADGGATLYVDSSEQVWIGPSSGGLVRMRGKGEGSITRINIDDDVVYSIGGGPDEIWVGRRLGGVTRIREESGKLQSRSFTARDGLAPGIVNAVLRARDGTVWAGSLGGQVSRIQNGRVMTFSRAHGLSNNAIITLYETPDGAIWAGTTGGLAAFRNGSWRNYDGEDGLPPGRVNSLALDAEGVLWIGSSSGLFYWSGTRIESARNVPHSLRKEIYGVAADDIGNLWITTDLHVVSVSREPLLGRSNTPVALREFGRADGLPSTRGVRRDHAVARDPSGRIWFSLQGGISVLNPTLPSAMAPASVNLESMSVDGRPLFLENGARYPSSRQRVVFNFIGVSLSVPGRVRYRYLLEGYDEDWSQPGESREAVYTNLRPARYTFRVMASNSEGLWNGEPISVPFEVEPQLVETWWFRAVGICIGAGAILAGFRYRIARLQAAMNLRFEERLAERTRIARELHDTLLQSFQGLMLRLQVVNELLPPGRAKEEFERSLERGDQALEEGRVALYDLRSSATSTNDLAEAVNNLADEMATPGSPRFSLVVEGRARDLHPIIRDELYCIVREALRNAITHANAKHIEAEITYEERMLRVRIRDDGTGIPGETVEKGRPGHYGLSGMRERARQIGAKLEIWSKEKAGTEIELSVAGSTAYRAFVNRSHFRFSRRKQVD